MDRSVQVAGDVHHDVAERIRREGRCPVLDVGGGDGYLGSLLPAGWPTVVLDRSPT